MPSPSIERGGMKVMDNDAVAKALKAGKQFEADFSRQYRATGFELVRLVDANRNRNPCDYFSVLPGMVCFYELKSTACQELPLIDIKPHQLESMAEYDGAALGVHAGFVIQFRVSTENTIYYISGQNLRAYVEDKPSSRYLDADYLEANGILIPTSKPTPRAQKYSIMDISTFLTQLRKS